MKRLCPICRKEVVGTTKLRDNFLWLECSEHGEMAMDIDKYLELIGQYIGICLKNGVIEKVLTNKDYDKLQEELLFIEKDKLGFNIGEDNISIWDNNGECLWIYEPEEE